MTTFQRLMTVFHSVFEDQVQTESLSEEARLREDVGINSIGMLYMAMALEGEFGIKFTNEDFPSLVTVGDVLHCIEEKLK